MIENKKMNQETKTMVFKNKKQPKINTWVQRVDKSDNEAVKVIVNVNVISKEKKKVQKAQFKEKHAEEMKK